MFSSQELHAKYGKHDTWSFYTSSFALKWWMEWAMKYPYNIEPFKALQPLRKSFFFATCLFSYTFQPLIPFNNNNWTEASQY